MIENLDFLPVWITRAGAPAVSVMIFFWKGDEALSEDFKKWLTQKILGLKLTVPNIASIEPLGKVFDFIYGPRYFGLTTFARVVAISIIALLVVLLPFLSRAKVELNLSEHQDHIKAIFLVAMNLFFGYLSVTKSRLLIEEAKEFKHSAIRFFVVDLFGTMGMLAAYRAVVDFAVFGKWGSVKTMLKGELVETIFVSTPISAFYLTIYMSLLLSLLYLVSLMFLKFFGLIAKAVPLILWMLPVKTLPVRSIGIVAGAILFCFLEILHALAG